MAFREKFLSYLRVYFKASILSLSICIISASGAVAQNMQRMSIIDAAKKEGKVVWYEALSVQYSTQIIKKFEEKYPFIKVEVTRLASQRVLERVQTETRAKVYKVDVLQTGAYAGSLMKRLSLFQKYQSPESEAFHAGNKDPDGYWTDMWTMPFVISYNTRLLSPKEAPASFEDLLDPKWKGKISLDVESEEWFVGMLQLMGEEKGLTFMKKLAAQNLNYRRGHTQQLQLLVAGEFLISAELHLMSVEAIKSKGAPVNWVKLKEIPSSLHPIGLYANAPHPNAAKLLVDFILSEEGQSLISSLQAGVSGRIGIKPNPPALLEGIKLMPNNPDFMMSNHDRFTKLYKEIFRMK